MGRVPVSLSTASIGSGLGLFFEGKYKFHTSGQDAAYLVFVSFVWEPLGSILTSHSSVCLSDTHSGKIHVTSLLPHHYCTIDMDLLGQSPVCCHQCRCS